MKKTIFLLLLLSVSLTIFTEELIRTISVVGSGEMVIKPDTVVISTGVDSGDPVIGVALEENNIIMSQIFEGLADLGIVSEDIETSNYNVYLYRPYNDKDSSEEEYRVSNSIKINIKQLDLVDTVIDTIITLGANKINGIYFTFENAEEYQNELRDKAIKDARDKAEYLAKLENMKVKSVISIREEGTTQDAEERNFAYAMAEPRAKSAISSGMETLVIRYNVVYQIVSR